MRNRWFLHRLKNNGVRNIRLSNLSIPCFKLRCLRDTDDQPRWCHPRNVEDEHGRPGPQQALGRQHPQRTHPINNEDQAVYNESLQGKKNQVHDRPTRPWQEVTFYGFRLNTFFFCCKGN